MSDDLERWQRKRGFYATAPQWVYGFWRTQPSFEWFVKSRRSELANAGAICKLGRDWFVDVDALQNFVASQFNGGTA
jgi:hypothetical protein